MPLNCFQDQHSSDFIECDMSYSTPGTKFEHFAVLLGI